MSNPRPVGTLAGLRPVLAVARPWRKELRYGIASGVTQQILFVAGATIAAYAAGRAVRGAHYDDLSLWLLALVIIVLPQVRTPWLEALSLQAVANRVEVDLRARVFAVLAALTPSGLSGRRSGELGHTAMSDVAVIRRFYAEDLAAVVVAGVVPVVAVVALAAMSWLLAVAVAPLLALATVAPIALQTRSHDSAAATGAHRAAISAETVDIVQGLREIVSFGAEGGVLADLARQEALTGDLQAIDNGRSALEGMAIDLFATAGPLAALAIGAALAARGSIGPALVAPAVVLAALAFAPAARLGRAAESLRQVAVAGDRVLALLASDVPVQDPGHPIPAVPRHPGVDFTDVSFRYGPEEPEALRHVSFSVAPGETVALVGHSGAGKSTCVNLLLRFWDPTSGRISVGGTDIRTLSQSALHRTVGLVPQDVYLFSGTIRDNLRLGRPDASDEDIEAAARAVVAWELITALPDGLDSEIGERGVQLSGGQRQRLAIARALLARPEVLVLDEPVSNLDSESERALAHAMAAVRQGRTTIVVAHRLSTVRGADRVIVLDQGTVAEIGTHEQLVAHPGVYRHLVEAQLGPRRA